MIIDTNWYSGKRLEAVKYGGLWRSAIDVTSRGVVVYSVDSKQMTLSASILDGFLGSSSLTYLLPVVLEDFAISSS